MTRVSAIASVFKWYNFAGLIATKNKKKIASHWTKRKRGFHIYWKRICVMEISKITGAIIDASIKIHKIHRARFDWNLFMKKFFIMN